GCDTAQHIKDGCIRGDLKIKVEEAVHENADATKQCSYCQRSVDALCPVIKFGPGVPESENEEPDSDSEAGHARLGEQLQVGVVGGCVDKEGGIEAAELGIGERECAKAPSQNGPRTPHAQAVAIDGKPYSAAEFLMRLRVNAGESPGKLIASNPD